MRTLLLTAVALLGLAAPVALTSCDNDTPNQLHQLNFIPLQSGGRLCYADQSTDTVGLQSTDSWTLAVATPQGTPAWLTAAPESGRVEANHFVTQPLALRFSANTTGAPRPARLNVTAAAGTTRTIGLPVVQLSWLDIRRPAPTMLRPTGETDTRRTAPTMLRSTGKIDSPASALAAPIFIEPLPYKAGTVVCGFVLYDTTDPAHHSLTSDASWLTLSAADATPAAGHHEVTLTFTENPDHAPRTARLALTSAGVTTYITYTQAAKP